jgi:Anti-sigma-K factor rskA, C-terminal/Putative zinc-finger
MNEHDEIAELLGAYALDAVDPDEAAVVEAHLAVCPRCAAEVADHREVAAMLAHTGAPAPEGLWSRISASLEEAPPEMDIPLALPDRARSGVVDLAGQRARRRPQWIPGAAVAAALVVVALIAGIVIAGDGDGGDRPEQIAAPVLEDVARRVMNDPDAVKAVLSSPDGDLEAPAAIDVDGSGYLMGNTLPALDEAQTYQLWGIRGDLVVSLGVLGSSPGVVAFHADPGVEALAITLEVAGGVVSSANPAYLVGELS